MEDSPEKFGSLSLEDIKDFSSLLEPLKNEQAEALALGQDNFSTVGQYLSPDFSWALYYELPLQQFLILVMAIAGCLEEVERAHQRGENLLRFMLNKSFNHLQGKEPQWDGGHKGQFDKEDVIAMAYAMRGFLGSLQFYGRYINHMVADVREGKDPDDKMFFDVLRLDPTAIGCPSFTARLSMAHMQGDMGFMNELQLALAGKPHRDRKSTRLNSSH